MTTLTNKYNYNATICNIPINDLLIDMCSIDNKNPDRLIITKKTHTYDVYITIIYCVSNMFIQHKEDIKMFLRGDLDNTKYLAIIHEELANLYICYKNTSDEEKISRGFSNKNIHKYEWDDLFIFMYIFVRKYT